MSNRECYERLKDYGLILNYYVKQYYIIYKKLHKKYCSKKKIIKLQEIINESLNTIVQITQNIKEINNCKIIRKEELYETRRQINTLYEDYIFTKKLYHTLIDDIVIKYMCNDDCGMFSILFLEYKENSTYDYNQVKKYIDEIKHRFKEEKAYYVVCDLCSINLDCGDIIYNKNKRSMIDYIELKETNSINSLKIIKIAMGQECEGYLNEKEKKQLERIKRQLEKHKIIDNKLFSHPIIHGRYPKNIIKVKTFKNKLKRDLILLKRKKYIESKVDDCVSYLIVNNNFKPINNEEKFTKIYNSYSTDDQSIFSYDDFLFDSNVYRPYMLKWSMSDYKKIIRREYEIYFKIDLKKLINKLKSKGVVVYPAKQTDETKKNHGILIYNGKNYCYTIGKYEFLIGTMLVYRIPACLFTSDDTINFFLEIFKENSRILKLIDNKIHD